MSISIEEELKNNWRYRLAQNIRIRQAMFRKYYDKHYEPVTYRPWMERQLGNPKQCPDRVDTEMCDCENELENY